MRGGKIIAEGLQGIHQVIEILNLSYWSHASECKPDTLSENRGFPDTCVGDPELPVFLL